MKALCYHENVRRGVPEFPVGYYYLDEIHPRYQMPYHWHEEAELLRVLTGTFTLVMDGESYQLTAGSIIYIAPGRLHGGEPLDSVYECIVFDARLLMRSSAASRSFIHDVHSRKLDIIPEFPSNHPDVYKSLLRMFEVLRIQTAGYELIVGGVLMIFFGEAWQSEAYIAHPQPQDREIRNVLKLKKVFEMRESRPNNPPSLTEMSAAVGMVPKYFCTFFKEATHFTPIEYVRYYRIEQACYEIAATEKNVTEIAMSLGFNDVNYFIRCFKKYKKVTPGQYVKAIRNR